MDDRRPNKWLSLVAWLLPSSAAKNWILRRLGNDVASDATIGVTLVLNCGRFTVGSAAVVGSLNIFRNLAGVHLASGSLVGNFNQFTAAADYQRFSRAVGRLEVVEIAIISNRHYFDCSGQVILKRGSAVGGVRSILQTHEMDINEDETTVGRIVLGESAMTGSACVLLRDAVLPDRSILAAGSVLPKASRNADMPDSSLYGGAPARRLRELNECKWWNRTSHTTPVTAFDDSPFQQQP